MATTRPERIAERAYARYLARDNGSGSELNDWLAAEQDIDEMDASGAQPGHPGGVTDDHSTRPEPNRETAEERDRESQVPRPLPGGGRTTL